MLVAVLFIFVRSLLLNPPSLLPSLLSAIDRWLNGAVVGSEGVGSVVGEIAGVMACLLGSFAFINFVNWQFRVTFR